MPMKSRVGGKVTRYWLQIGWIEKRQVKQLQQIRAVEYDNEQQMLNSSQRGLNGSLRRDELQLIYFIQST